MQPVSKRTLLTLLEGVYDFFLYPLWIKDLHFFLQYYWFVLQHTFSLEGGQEEGCYLFSASLYIKE